MAEHAADDLLRMAGDQGRADDVTELMDGITRLLFALHDLDEISRFTGVAPAVVQWSYETRVPRFDRNKDGCR